MITGHTPSLDDQEVFNPRHPTPNERIRLTDLIVSDERACAWQFYTNVVSGELVMGEYYDAGGQLIEVGQTRVGG